MNVLTFCTPLGPHPLFHHTHPPTHYEKKHRIENASMRNNYLYHGIILEKMSQKEMLEYKLESDLAVMATSHLGFRNCTQFYERIRLCHLVKLQGLAV